MPSARVSKSSGDSPVEKPAESSARRAKAVNTSPHLPQRTWPPATRSTSADNLKTVWHFEHCVYTALSASPSVDAAPVIAFNDLHHIKSIAVGGLHRVGLRLQQSRQEQVPSRLAGFRQCRRQFDQRARENIGHDTIRLPQADFDALHVDARGNA